MVVSLPKEYIGRKTVGSVLADGVFDDSGWREWEIGG